MSVAKGNKYRAMSKAPWSSYQGAFLIPMTGQRMSSCALAVFFFARIDSKGMIRCHHTNLSAVPSTARFIIPTGTASARRKRRKASKLSVQLKIGNANS